MGLEYLIAFIVVIILAGIYKIITESKRHHNSCCLCLVVKDCEDRIEGLLRSLVADLRKTGKRYSLAVIVLGSQDQTAGIVRRMSEKLSFIVWEITTHT